MKNISNARDEDIILNYQPEESNRRKIKILISKKAEKIRELLKLNNYLKEEIKNHLEESDRIKTILNKISKDKMNKEAEKLFLIKNHIERNVIIMEKNKLIKNEIKNKNINLFNLNNKLNKELEEPNLKLQNLKDELFIISNQIELKNNIIENYKKKIKNFNYVREKEKEIYINDKSRKEFDHFYLELSLFFDELLHKKLKKLNKNKNTNNDSDKKISSKKHIKYHKYIINPKKIIWEIDNKNNFDNNNSEDNSLIFQEFELLSNSFIDNFQNNINDNKLNLIPYFYQITNKTHIHSMDDRSINILLKKEENTSNNSFKDNISKEKFIIPKLNFESIKFKNEIKNNLILKKNNSLLNQSFINNKKKSDDILEIKIKEMKDKIKFLKKKISNNKKTINNFKIFCKNYDSFYFIGLNILYSLSSA